MLVDAEEDPWNRIQSQYCKDFLKSLDIVAAAEKFLGVVLRINLTASGASYIMGNSGDVI